MRFFSNDARESADEQDDGQATDQQTGEARPERAQSGPVAVPHQRPPSPWSNTPTADDPATVADATPGGDDTDPPPFHEPSPQPTAFGASTVGGAVAASATANPVNDRRTATDRDSPADAGVGDDADVAPGDGVVTSSTNTYTGSTAGSAPDTVPESWTKREGHSDPDPVDIPLDDSTSPATAPDQDAAERDDPDPATSGALKDDDPEPATDEPAADQPLDDSLATDDPHRDPEAGTTPDPAPADSDSLKDDGDFDDPQVVDPVTDTVLDADHADSTPADIIPAAVVAAPVAAAAATTPDSLFDPADARTFQDRWREVQLRFVDSPKDAAGDAAKLVDEAVEKLTARLRSQHQSLHSDTDDTEQLRVQLRSYRDVLNHILSL